MGKIQLNHPVIPFLKKAEIIEGVLKETFVPSPQTWASITPLPRSSDFWDQIHPEKGETMRSFYKMILRKKKTKSELFIRQIQTEEGRLLHVISPWIETQKGFLESVVAEFLDPFLKSSEKEI
jgi:hypothetical protein